MALLQGAMLFYAGSISSYFGQGYPNAPTTKWEDDSGKKQSLVHFNTQFLLNGSPLAFPAQSVLDNWNDGRISLITFGTWDLAAPSNNFSLRLSEIAAGTWDTQFRAWFTAAKNVAHPFIIRPFPEMNLGFLPWGIGTISNGGHTWTNSLADFHAAWQKLYNLAQSVGATNVTFCFCPNIRLNGPASSGTGQFTYAQLNPGNGYWHLWGLDGYNMGVGAGNSGWLTFNQVFHGTGAGASQIADSYAEICAIDSTKYGVICEFGCDSQRTTAGVYDYASKAAWYTDALGTQMPGLTKLLGISYFNWNTSGFAKSDGYDLTIEDAGNLSLTVATSAWRNGLASSTYLASVVMPPDLAPITQPFGVSGPPPPPVIVAKPAPPPNDSPNGAYILNNDVFSMAVNRTGATTDANEPVPSIGFLTNTVWYSFTTTTLGSISLSVSEPSIRIGMALYTRHPGASPEFVQVTASSGVVPGNPASFAIGLTAGVQYYIQIGQLGT